MSDFTINSNGSVTTPAGFTAGAAATGMKQGGAFDVTLIVSDTDCCAAGVFTKNQVKGAPIIVNQAVLQQNPTQIRGVIANSKYSNACTGQPGIDDVHTSQQIAATALNCVPHQFFMLSTGVIGVPMPMDNIEQGIRQSAQALGDNGLDAAQAIMTTDTRPKHLSVEINTDSDTNIHIGGICKGSGMIHPNMATMLGILTTDAQIAQPLLQTALSTACDLSFNRISVDGDTSTSDCVLLLANSASGVVIDEHNIDQFQAALNEISIQLAQMVVRDGEGVSKFVEITVTGTDTNDSAHQIANTIATSPLVKTAFAGSDANWGRILMAAGRAGVPFNQDDTILTIGDFSQSLELLRGGTPTGYEESTADAIFRADDIQVALSVGAGDGTSTVWTGDLTHDYITINADYRT